MASSSRVIQIEILATDKNASAVFDHVATKSQATANATEGHFAAATSKIGGSFKALDSTLGQFGIPFTGALSQIGGSLEKAGTEATSFGGKLSAIGGAEATVAAVALAAVGTAAIKMATDYETSHARLVAATAATGQNLADFGGIVSAADSKLEKFGFTNAQTENSMSRLVTATGNVTKSAQLLGLAADIARARGLSLSDATDLLTKAEQGRYLQLTRLGIVSKQQAADFRTTGDAIAYLTSKYSGQAAAYADTFAGKLATLKATVTDLGVALGESLIPKVEAFASFLSSTITAFESANEATNGLLGKLVALGAAIPIAAFAIDKLATAAKAVGVFIYDLGARMGFYTKAQTDATEATKAGTAANIEAATSTDTVAAAQQGRIAALIRAQTAETAAVAARQDAIVADEEYAAAELRLGDVWGANAAKSTELAAAQQRQIAASAAATAADEERIASLEALQAQTERVTAAQAAESGSGLFAGLVGAAGVAASAISEVALPAAIATAAIVGIGTAVQNALPATKDYSDATKDLAPGLAATGDEAKKAYAALASLSNVTASDAIQKFAEDSINGASATQLLNDKIAAFSSVIHNHNKALAEEAAHELAAANGGKVHNVEVLQAISGHEKEVDAIRGAIKGLSDLEKQYGASAVQSAVLQQAEKQLADDLVLSRRGDQGATYRLAEDKRNVTNASRDQAAVQKEVNAAVDAGKNSTAGAADALDGFKSASQRLSDAQQYLKKDLEGTAASTGRIIDDLARLRSTTQANAEVDKLFSDATRTIKADADFATGSVITLADAFEKLGQSGTQDISSSFKSISQAAFAGFDATTANESAQDKLSKALDTLHGKLDTTSQSHKTAIATEIEHEQKTLALRDATKAMNDEAGKVADAQSALSKAQYDAQQATIAVTTAEQNYENVLHGVSSASAQAQDATESLEKARLDVKSSALDIRDAEKNLADARHKGTSEDVQRAEIALEEAKLKNHDASKAASEAQRIYNGTLHGFPPTSNEAKSAQDQLTQAFWSSVSANQGVTSAQHALRDAQDNVASSALALKRAQADLAGELENKSNKALETQRQKLEDVKSAMKDVANTSAEVAIQQGASLQSAISGEIQFLQQQTQQNPALQGVFDSTIKNLLLLAGATAAAKAPSILGAIANQQNAADIASQQRLNTHKQEISRGGLRFADGGWVPGLSGAPIPSLVHGGEYVVSREELAGRPRADSPVALLKNAQATEQHIAAITGKPVAASADAAPTAQFAVGGWVPGRKGIPVQALLHAGEYVISVEELRGIPRGDTPVGLLKTSAKLTPEKISKAATATSTAGPISQAVLAYEDGGWVPGQPSTAVPTVLHGGEYVVSQEELRGKPRADSPFYQFLNPSARNDLPASAAIGATAAPTVSTEGFAKVGGDLIGGFSQGIHDHWAKNVQPFLQSAKDNVTSHFVGTDQWLMQHGENVIDGFYNGLQSSWPKVEAFFAILPGLLGGKTAAAVGAVGNSWAKIRFAFGVPVNYTIDNILNKLIDDVNIIAAAAGMSAIGTHVPDVAIGTFATGGVVERDQLARVHAGEGILPATSLQKLGAPAFEILKSGTHDVSSVSSQTFNSHLAQLTSNATSNRASTSSAVNAPSVSHASTSVSSATSAPRTSSTSSLFRATNVNAPSSSSASTISAPSSTAFHAATNVNAPSRSSASTVNAPSSSTTNAPTTSIRSYGAGGLVERDQIAKVHAGEIVVPAAEIAALPKTIVKVLFGAPVTHEKVSQAALTKGPLGSYATGGIVNRDQVAKLHAGEGVLPPPTTLKLTPTQYAALQISNINKNILTNLSTAFSKFTAPAIKAAVVGPASKVSQDIVTYLGKIPQPIGPSLASFGGGRGGGATPFAGPLPTGGDPRTPGHSITDWAVTLLHAMGLTPTDTDVRALIRWAAQESGGYHPGNIAGLYNPLNTTEGHFGYAGQGGSQGNIKGYASFDQGIQNQAWNLLHTRGAGYEAIVGALAAGNNARAIFDAIDNSHFGTHGLATGGITDFPKSGAPAILHGKEAVLPLPDGFDIRKLTAPTIPASAFTTGRSSTVTNHFTLNVQSLDPYKSRQLILQALKEIERTNGYVPLKTAAA